MFKSGISKNKILIVIIALIEGQFDIIHKFELFYDNYNISIDISWQMMALSKFKGTRLNMKGKTNF